MFKRAISLAFLFLVLLSGLVFFWVLKPKKCLLKRFEPSLSRNKVKSSSYQIRLEVQKDFWIANHLDRLHHRLTSPRSVLTAYLHQNHFELIEELEEMKCYLQEEVSEKEQTQQIRFIKSHFGTYDYSNQSFEANQVHLALFRLPGNQLKTPLDLKSAFLKGIAYKIFLSFSSHKPYFHAEKFQAHIYPENDKKNL